MNINDLICERWNEDDPLGSLSAPVDHYDRHTIELLKRYHEVKKAPVISRHEAEMLIAADEELAEDIFTYRYDNTPIPIRSGKKMVSILKRIKPIDQTFYRGVEIENYDDKHIMPIQSWATSVHVAKYFGDIIYETLGPVKGVELNSLFYWNGMLYDTSDGLGDGGMGEWFLLNPKKELMD